MASCGETLEALPPAPAKDRRVRADLGDFDEVTACRGHNDAPIVPPPSAGLFP